MRKQNTIILCDNVILEYHLPDHLRNCSDIETMRIKDLDSLDKELKERGSSLEEKITKGIIYREKFPGMVLDMRNISVDLYNDLAHMDVIPIHPHRADLALKEDITLINKPRPITVNAVLELEDNSVILGVRGGSVGSGEIGIIPGGHAEYREHINNLIGHLSLEFEEELGYAPCETEKISLIGVSQNRDTHGVNALYLARTTLDYQEIESRWKKAKDSYEHQSLIQCSKNEITTLAEEGNLQYKNTQYTTTPFFQDCLANYLFYR